MKNLTTLIKDEIIETCYNAFNMIITKKYKPEDEDNFLKHKIIDKIKAGTSNIYILEELVTKRHNEIINHLNHSI